MEGFEAAVDAMNSANVAELKQLLERQPGLATARDEDGCTLLNRLFHGGKKPRAVEAVQVLLEAGALVDAVPTEHDGTPLSSALCTNQVEVVRLLLESGADLQGQSGYAADVSVLDLADIILENLERHGETGFQEMMEVLSTAAGRTVPKRPALGNTTPIFMVSDAAAALAYYTRKLGFLTVFVDDYQDCSFAIVKRGAAEIHLCKCADASRSGKARLRISAAAIDPLFEEFRNAEARIVIEPRDLPWEERQIEVGDLDGNVLVFWGPLTS